MLENKMIDINKTDSEGLNAFWIAGRCGHGEIMQVLAEHGIDIFNKDKQGTQYSTQEPGIQSERTY